MCDTCFRAVSHSNSRINYGLVISYYATWSLQLIHLEVSQNALHLNERCPHRVSTVSVYSMSRRQCMKGFKVSEYIALALS